MDDAKKTKAQLIDELTALSQRVAELEVAEIERNRAEEALREGETRYRTLVEGSIQGISVLDRDATRLFVNPSYAAIFGFNDPHELLGKPVGERIAPHERARLRHDSLLRYQGKEAPVRYVYQGIRKNGSLIWLEAMASIIDWDGHPRQLITLMDITERKQAEGDLIQAERLASLGTFAAGLAHELNNPLYAIASTAEHARDTLMSPNKLDEVDSCFADILEDAGRCSEIVRRVLNFARQGRGDKLPMDLYPLIQTTYDLTQRYAEQRGVLMSLELAPAQPRIVANGEDIELALVNLIRNAVEATPKGGRVTLRIVMATERVQIRIQDTGIGLSHEEEPHVFEPFYTTREGSGGTGLGLSITHRIITDHDGAIGLQSAPDQGTIVWVELPLSAPEVIPSS